MITTLIPESKKIPITDAVITILLEQYNKDNDRPLYLEEQEDIQCLGTVMKYTFFKAVGDLEDEYIRGTTLSSSDTMQWLAHELNNKI